MSRRTLGSMFLMCTILCAGMAPSPTHAQQQVTARELADTIRTLAKEIRDTQAADGSLGRNQAFPVGCTALGVMALRASGYASDDPVIRRATDFLAQNLANVNRGTYEVSLAMVAMQNVDPRRYGEQLLAGAKFLVDAQAANGGWSYGQGGGRADNSNSQYAILGLHAAMMAGIRIPDKIWRDALLYWRAGQQRDGGWHYTVNNGNSYGSMTCAGLASTYLCNMWLHVATQRCTYVNDRRVAAGLAWLENNFSVAQNPGKGAGYYWYYLYALERSGVILARRYFGRHDWYRLGVEHIVGGRPQNAGQFYDQCFRLLFLGKGNAPLVVHKAQFATPLPNMWERHVFDIKFLVLFAERQLDKFLDWQIVPLGSPLEELLKAPLLYVSGAAPLSWTEQEMNRFRDYIAAGGFALVEAANGDERWGQTFPRYLARYFPEDNLVDLPADHPIYNNPYKIPLEYRRLKALMGPCWVSMVYAPDGISCRWDVADFDHPDFRLGMNIIAYAVGEDELKGKLEEVEYELPSLQERERRRGAFTVGQLVHDSDWKPHKLAWNTVLTRVNDKVGIDVYNRTVPIEIGENTPFEGQMLYITSSRKLELTAAQREAIKTYIERGGFVFAEAACSSPEFDQAFREIMREMFPEQRLEEMPVGHPLFELGEKMNGMNYTEALRRLHPTLDRPVLEHIEIDGRSVIVYSKYDMSSAIEGHPCHTCPSILEPSASQLALKIVLYGLTS